MDKLKIVQISSTYPPYKGGIGNICQHFTSELLKLGVEVSVLTLKTTKEHLTNDSIYIRRLRPVFAFGNAGWVPQIFFIALKSNVIHFNYPFIGGESALLVKLFKPRIKIIVSYHMDLHETGLKGILFRLYQIFALLLIKCFADVVIFSSFDYGHSCKLASFLKNNPKRCRELPYGVDGDLFHPSHSIHERIINQEVLFVAALDKAHAFKGLSILLQAFADLKTGKLAVIGDGELKSHYQELVAELKVDDRVTFLGKLSDQDLAREFRTSTLFVLPSITRSEAFGLVILEAMSSGIPAIASNLPGVRSLIVNGEDGFLIDPGNINELREKIRLLLDNATLNERLGKAGRRKVIKKYSWPALVRILKKDIYGFTTQ